LPIGQGLGVKKDESAAAQWFKRAADQQCVLGEFLFSEALRQGEGVAKDMAEGMRLCKLVASRGYVPAQSELGWCYCNGQGVAEDRALGIIWTRKAALTGFTPAMLNLGAILEKEHRNVEAEQWYLRAAKQGDVHARRALGRLYANGSTDPMLKIYGSATDIPQNLVEAYAWLLVAAPEADVPASPERDALAKRLRADQLEQASRRAATLGGRAEGGAGFALPSPCSHPRNIHGVGSAAEHPGASEA